MTFEIPKIEKQYDLSKNESVEIKVKNLKSIVKKIIWDIIISLIFFA